jgi:hypothetical protein
MADGNEDRPTHGAADLKSELDAARRDEQQALKEAVALLEKNAPRDQVEGAYRRCEHARARKNQLLRPAGDSHRQGGSD